MYHSICVISAGAFGLCILKFSPILGRGIMSSFVCLLAVFMTTNVSAMYFPAPKPEIFESVPEAQGLMDYYVDDGMEDLIGVVDEVDTEIEKQILIIENEENEDHNIEAINYISSGTVFYFELQGAEGETLYFALNETDRCLKEMEKNTDLLNTLVYWDYFAEFAEWQLIKAIYTMNDPVEIEKLDKLWMVPRRYRYIMKEAGFPVIGSYQDFDRQKDTVLAIIRDVCYHDYELNHNKNLDRDVDETVGNTITVDDISKIFDIIQMKQYEEYTESYIKRDINNKFEWKCIDEKLGNSAERAYVTGIRDFATARGATGCFEIIMAKNVGSPARGGSGGSNAPSRKRVHQHPPVRKTSTGTRAPH